MIDRDDAIISMHNRGMEIIMLLNDMMHITSLIIYHESI
jgi:hypothetical protein